MLGTGALGDVPVSSPLLLAAFCGAAVVYGVDRAVVAAPEDAWNRPGRARWMKAHRTWLYVEAVVLSIAGGLALSALAPATVAWSVGLAGLGGLHLASGGTGRPVGGLGMGIGKPLVVAGAWALGAAILPVVEAGGALDATVWGVAGYRFLFVLPNVLLSDWGDRAGDRAAGLASWTRWGTERGLRWASTVMLVGAMTGAVGASWWGTRPLLWGVDAVGPLLMLGAVWGVDPQRSAHRFLLDAIVAWPGVTALVAAFAS
ncbi:MAG: hypothetical protein BRD55_07745 [Bacteroidetes bacterium SW_9_63_38]|nr:MAG: hypothetical protein BRD55_07745 [Bacteroidetes bacterium SW_9_63_38]